MAIDPASPWWATLNPVQRQLVGEASSTANRWGVGWDGVVDESIPLRAELRERGLLDRQVPYLR